MEQSEEAATRVAVVLKSKGKLVVLVDPEDYERFRYYSWSISKRDHTHYAHTMFGGRQFYLHRAILGLAFGDPRIGEHANGNGLDCRRSNLRIADHVQNAQNIGVRKANVTGYLGVYPTGARYAVRVRHEGKRIQIGTYDTVEEAAKAYDKFILETRGAFAVVNFDKDETP